MEAARKGGCVALPGRASRGDTHRFQRREVHGNRETKKHQVEEGCRHPESTYQDEPASA